MKLEKLYLKMARKYPQDNLYQIEQRVRNRVLLRKVLVSALLFALSIAALLILTLCNIEGESDLGAVLKIIYGGAAIASVCYFATAMHDPLTEDEAQELFEKEKAEKQGRK